MHVCHGVQSGHLRQPGRPGWAPLWRATGRPPVASRQRAGAMRGSGCRRVHIWNVRRRLACGAGGAGGQVWRGVRRAPLEPAGKPRRRCYRPPTRSSAAGERGLCALCRNGARHVAEARLAVVALCRRAWPPPSAPPPVARPVARPVAHVLSARGGRRAASERGRKERGTDLVSHGSQLGTGLSLAQGRQVRASDGRGLTDAVDRPALCQPP